MGTAQSQELNWYTDVKEAISLGNKEDKPLLLFSQEVIGVAGVSVAKEVLFTPRSLQNGLHRYSCQLRFIRRNCAVSN
jgi:hypothetical protein